MTPLLNHPDMGALARLEIVEDRSTGIPTALTGFLFFSCKSELPVVYISAYEILSLISESEAF